MRLGLDAGIRRKVRCGFFGKSRTVRSLRVVESFIVKVLEKFLAKLFWEKSGEVDCG